MSVMCASGWPPKPQVVTSPTVQKPGSSALQRNRPSHLPTKIAPRYLPGAFELALGSLAAVPRTAELFRSGQGMGWHEHADGVFHGCEKFFRPGYAANLVSAWIPAVHDVKEKLEGGARVADIGCGKRASTLLLAKAFSNSRFFRLRLSRQVDRSCARVCPTRRRCRSAGLAC